MALRDAWGMEVIPHVVRWVGWGDGFGLAGWLVG